MTSFLFLGVVAAVVSILLAIERKVITCQAQRNFDRRLEAAVRGVHALQTLRTANRKSRRRIAELVRAVYNNAEDAGVTLDVLGTTQQELDERLADTVADKVLETPFVRRDGSRIPAHPFIERGIVYYRCQLTA